jgi:hypothetical protein
MAGFYVFFNGRGKGMEFKRVKGEERRVKDKTEKMRDGR